LETVIDVQTKVTDERIRDLLVGALEGGSDYWIVNVKYKLPKGLSVCDFKEGGKFALDLYYNPSQLIPFHEGCSLLISVDMNEDGKLKRHVLNREAMEKGVQLMSEKYPRHYADLINENDDSDTSDVFLQLALFGEIVFG
jgi:hypothetical protein